MIDDALEHLTGALQRQQRAAERAAAQESTCVFARCVRTSNQSVANNTLTIVNYDVIQSDDLNCVALSPWRFIVPMPGYYLVSAALQFAASTAWAPGETASLSVFVNEVEYARLAFLQNIPSGVSVSVSLSGSALCELEEGNTLDFRVLQMSGSAQTILGAAMSTYCAIVKLDD